MLPPLQRNLDYISLWIVGLPGRAVGQGLALLWRLDLHDLILLGALSVLGCLEHDHALATDEVLRSPPSLWVYLPCYCDRPLVGFGLGGGAHASEPDHLGVLFSNLEGPHQPVAELGLLLLYVHQLGVVSAILKNLLHLHVHPETQFLVSFEPVTCNSSTFAYVLIPQRCLLAFCQ